MRRSEMLAGRTGRGLASRGRGRARGPSGPGGRGSDTLGVAKAWLDAASRARSAGRTGRGLGMVEESETLHYLTPSLPSHTGNTWNCGAGRGRLLGRDTASYLRLLNRAFSRYSSLAAHFSRLVSIPRRQLFTLQKPQGKPPDHTEVSRRIIGPHMALVPRESSRPTASAGCSRCSSDLGPPRRTPLL